jgi:glucose 1-dehydrogenase
MMNLAIDPSTVVVGGGRLRGQRAIVTGANSGIGAAIAEALAAEGANVVVNYVTRAEDAQRIVCGIRDIGGRAMAIQADVSQEHQVQAMFEQAIAELGSVDILVNNAAVRRDAPLVDMTLQDWDTVLRNNLTGQFLCARAAAREFIRRGVDAGRSCAAGKIICISSVHDLIPWSGHANYAASKGGVSMLMRTMAQELAVHKIRVNGVSPGAIRTPANHAAWSSDKREADVLQLIPYGRIGSAADIARAAVWLASDDSDYITGATLYVDGGMTLYPGFEQS